VLGSILLVSENSSTTVEALNHHYGCSTKINNNLGLRPSVMPYSSMLFYIPPKQRIRSMSSISTTRTTTRIHSMTIDPGAGLSVTPQDSSEEKDDKDEQQGGDHQLDLHHVNNDDAGSASKPFTTSSYLAAVAPEEKQIRKKRQNNKAMKDISFLRKRTSTLMSITAPENDLTNHEEPPHQQPHLSRGMKINTNTFNFLIDGWAFSGEPDACDKAMILLERMEEMYYKNGKDSPVCPDVRSYTKVINALSRSKQRDSANLAEQLLYKMEGMVESKENLAAKPNTFTYTAAIEAQTKSGVEGSPEKAEELLERMIKKYQSGDKDVVPNARCFNAAISSYAKCSLPGAAQQAEYLFEKLDGLYMSGVEEAKPNSFNYNSLITAWANCPIKRTKTASAPHARHRKFWNAWNSLTLVVTNPANRPRLVTTP